MTFLPIVERELRVAARQPATYRLRVRAALGAMLFGGYLLLTFGFFSGGALGARGAFSSLTFFAFIYCFLSGAQRTADSLSSEKREGTLGLLFLTDLKGYDIVLGKLLATSLAGFYGLIAIFPVLTIVLLTGGVGGWELFRVMLALTNALFFSCAVGLCVSSFSRQQQRAMTAASVILLLFWLVLPGLVLVWREIHPSSRAATVAGWLNPYFTYSSAGGIASPTLSREFWWSLLLTQAVAWSFLALASWNLPRSWQEKPAGRMKMRWRERWKQWCYGKAAVRAAYRTRLLDQNPFFWLAARDRLDPARVWGFLGVTLVGGFGIWALEPDTLVAIGILIGLVAIWLLAFKLGAAASASRCLAEQRASGALEFLLSTPLTPELIVQGQWLSLKRQFKRPVLFVLAASVVALVLLLVLPESQSEVSRTDKIDWLLAGLGVLIMFLADMAAMGWAGMWFGVSAKDHKQASSTCYMHVLLLPYLFLPLVSVLTFWWAAANAVEPPGFPYFLGWWFVLGMVNSIGHCYWARRQLLRQMRQYAANRYEAPKGGSFWLWLGRLLGRLWGRRVADRTSSQP